RLEIRRYFQLALGFELPADFLQHRAEIPQGSPGLGIGVQAKHWCADVSAVLLFREQAVGSSPIVDQPFVLFLPEWPQVLDGFGVASLPEITANIVKFETGLMKLETFAREIEQGHEQPPRVTFVTPD